MGSARIGIGIVGLSASGGWASRSHLPALKSLPDFELRALAASSRASADAAAAKYGVPLAFADAAELAARPEVDVVVVAVKVPEHRALVDAALGAGKAVYCEWPLGNGLAEAEEMATLAERRGVAAFAGLQGRSAPGVRYLRDLIAEGYVGEVLSTTVVASSGTGGPSVDPRGLFGLDRRNGVSMLTIQFGHTLDGLCWCLGEFDGLSATLANRRPLVRRSDTGETVEKTTDDQIAVSGSLMGGTVASVHFRTGLSRGTNFLWEINGTEGDLVITGGAARLQYGQFEISGGRGDDRTVAPLPVPDRYRLRPGAPSDFADAVAHAYLRLRDDLRNGTREVPRFADAVVRHRLIAAVEEAAGTGQLQSYDVRLPG